MLDNNTSKVDYTNKRRLAKIHKLKRENRALSGERKKLTDKEVAQLCEHHYLSAYNTYRYARHLCRISEQIGRNSAKIMRLRTLIQQSKIVWNNHIRIENSTLNCRYFKQEETLWEITQKLKRSS